MTDPLSNNELSKEAKALATEVYKDLVKPAVAEVGAVLGRSTKILLAPVRGMLWGFEKIEQIVVDGVNKRLEKVPDERRKTPDPEIAVPAMQALTYTAQNDTLREMYLNLLANSMDTYMEKDVHPSFVEIIKQMNALDAKVFRRLSNHNNSKYQKIVNPKIGLVNTNQFLVNSMPEWYMGWTIPPYNELDISASFIRLNKFGLIELMFDRTADDDYSVIEKSEFLSKKLAIARQNNKQYELEVRCTQSILTVNDYGIQFKNACL